MSKEDKIKAFDPNSAGLKDSDVFGLPFTPDESEVVLIPVPWEVTVSYGSGAASGPGHILESSFQVDLYHEEFPELWKAGISMMDLPEELMLRSTDLRIKAEKIIEMWEDGVDVDSDSRAKSIQKEINEGCESMNQWVEKQATNWLSKNKLVGLVGGDHSTPLGFFRSHSRQHSHFGILHIDAHMDLRKAYEGFTYSHASIMHNALQLPEVAALVQVGIRDYCEEENALALNEPDRIHVFTNASLQRQRFNGTTWHQQCVRIIEKLPEKVHVSFDIDGLDPTLCPNTGTPVPGGLTFDEATYLLSLLRDSGKHIIGFDLVEVSPGTTDWNGNVGARLLFHLCGCLWTSQAGN